MSGHPARPFIVRWDLAAATRFEDMRAAAHRNPAQRLIPAVGVRGKEYPPLEAFIDGIVIEGLTIIGGKPKMGKSFFVLSAGSAVASGGVAFGNPDREVNRAQVLYLGLEDGERRLAERLKIVAPTQDLDGMMLGFTWPRLDGVGAALLGQTIDEHGFGLVIVDPLSKARVPNQGGRVSYQQDVEAMTLIHELTRERPGLAIVLVTHTPKNPDSMDFLDHITGSTGVTGVADHVAVIQRGRGEADAVFKITGRDIEDAALSLSFNGGNWQERGSAAGMDLSKPRRAVLDALDELGGRATNIEISEKAERSPSTTLELLRALSNEGLVYQDDPGGPWVRR